MPTESRGSAAERVEMKLVPAQPARGAAACIARPFQCASARTYTPRVIPHGGGTAGNSESCGNVEEFRSTQQAQGILQCRVLRLIVVLGVEVLNLGFGEIQLRLGQFNDRRQAEVVAALREI